MKKVLVVGGCYVTARLFISRGMEVVNSVEEADLVCFTGGEDVNPALYGQKCHAWTHFNDARDEREMIVFDKCVKAGKPVVGICRGGQFLNVLSGGAMYQHVTKHGNPHNITDLRTGEVVYVSSTHHQMMKPSESGIIIAVATEGGSREWYNGEVREFEISDTDIEVVFYPETKALCFQPHPEYVSDAYSPMREYFFSLIDEFLK